MGTKIKRLKPCTRSTSENRHNNKDTRESLPTVRVSKRAKDILKSHAQLHHVTQSFQFEVMMKKYQILTTYHNLKIDIDYTSPRPTICSHIYIHPIYMRWLETFCKTEKCSIGVVLSYLIEFYHDNLILKKRCALPSL